AEVRLASGSAAEASSTTAFINWMRSGEKSAPLGFTSEPSPKTVNPARLQSRSRIFQRATDFARCVARCALLQGTRRYGAVADLIVEKIEATAPEGRPPALEARLSPFVTRLPSEERPRFRRAPHARFHIAEIVIPALAPLALVDPLLTALIPLPAIVTPCL